MAIPSYGAAPLAKTFLILRLLSLVALSSIVGITAYFVSLMVSASIEPPREIIGTLVVTSIAALYCLLSIPFFWAQANIGLFIMLVIDSLMLLAFIIVSVLLGRPLSFVNCAVIGDPNAAASATDVYAFTQSLSSHLGVNGATTKLDDWAGSSQAVCYETKAVWGLCISLCILLSCSALILPALWWKARKSSTRGYGKGEI